MRLKVFFAKAWILVFSYLNTSQWSHRVYETRDYTFIQREEIKNKWSIRVLRVVNGLRSAKGPNFVNVIFTGDLWQASVGRGFHSDCSLHQRYSVSLIFEYQVIFNNRGKHSVGIFEPLILLFRHR